MLSLGNAFNKEDILKFDKQIKEALHIQKDISYIVEYKIDGLSISIKYKNGKFLKAITRGDGFEGEDVSHNVVVIKDIPKIIEYKNELEVRGEIYMTNKIFKELNKKGLNFANPRNAASGTIRQLNSNIAQKRNLSAFLYSIPNPLDHNLKSQNKIITFLNKNGIKTNQKTFLLKNINEVIKKVEEMFKNRNKLEYLVDGIVIKVNNINL
jgi:DNA ligase (NAD+)